MHTVVRIASLIVTVFAILLWCWKTSVLTFLQNCMKGLPGFYTRTAAGCMLLMR
jgi:hypothetical protein